MEPIVTAALSTQQTISQVTPDNIETVGKTTTDMVDYIVDKIEEIVDEDKK